jgi:hypothetical protein
MRARWRRALQARAHSDFLPVPRRDDDLFLVEFPKSGVTWLTFLIANTNALLSDNGCHVTFFNVNDFVPDVQVAGHMTAPFTRVPGYRCFKSHSTYVWHYRKIFYLVRDPRHVMASYWTFLNTLGLWRGTLDQLIGHPQFGIRAWNAHVAGWLDGVDAAASFALVRYEDLVANTAGELERLYRLLGIPVSEEILSIAVERSSIDKMREAEIFFNTGHPALQNVEFVRRGEVGGARQALSGEQRRLIEREAAPVMRRLGYDVPDDSSNSP